ncbi:MAG: hypothetical protein KJO08_06910 [Gammaproteobacteria bacterium]|nr:hypothetical protein [Gammaproteobacteria bacterium]NNJ83995.1 hypothetical protein [Gammaproteobacteria bacterium]
MRVYRVQADGPKTGNPDRLARDSDSGDAGGVRMGKIKEKLREKDKDFISLHDLLTKMAEVTGDSYQDAAIFLNRELLERVLTNNDPQLYTYSEQYGPQETIVPMDWDPSVDPNAEPFQIFAQCLEQAAKYGIPPDNSPLPPENSHNFDDDIPF